MAQSRAELDLGTEDGRREFLRRHAGIPAGTLVTATRFEPSHPFGPSIWWDGHDGEGEVAAYCSTIGKTMPESQWAEYCRLAGASL